MDVGLLAEEQFIFCDVRAEVRESIEIYRPARWICAPCHAIQPVTPTANIVAMYEAIHELGCGSPLCG